MGWTSEWGVGGGVSVGVNIGAWMRELGSEEWMSVGRVSGCESE